MQLLPLGKHLMYLLLSLVKYQMRTSDIRNILFQNSTAILPKKKKKTNLCRLKNNEYQYRLDTLLIDLSLEPFSRFSDKYIFNMVKEKNPAVSWLRRELDFITSYVCSSMKHSDHRNWHQQCCPVFTCTAVDEDLISVLCEQSLLEMNHWI